MIRNLLSWLVSHARSSLAVKVLMVVTLVTAVWTLIVAVKTLRTADRSLQVAITQREDARELGAWSIISISPQARGNIGQKEAVEFLLEHGEDLKSINLRQAYLVEVKLSGADLWNARLEGAILERASLVGANLLIARLSGADMRGANLTAANMQCAKLSPGIAADGSGLFFAGADLRSAILEGTNFDGADLKGVDLTDADISDASFRTYLCDVDDRRDAQVKPKQLAAACADPSRLPKLPQGPEFANLRLQKCPTD